MVSFWPTPSKSEETWLELCEANDARNLIDTFRDARWVGERHELGRWSFRHTAKIICKQKGCVVETGLDMLFGGKHESEFATAEQHFHSVLPDHDRDATTRWILTNEIATELRTSIISHSYRSPDHQITATWVDYGKLAKLIRVRSRTQIKCHSDRAYCTIDDNSVAFIPYDEHHECGYLSNDSHSHDLHY